ncbi:hypothetical protein POVWA2_057360 [Plasmodium ovale wallikeri]|uniref:Uncharacterized protein n=1 Tax=Plasmodium ovale wallikeri TaxID=864142 RepID=A0A1A8ZY04_PLAOA|nr:hypothetical protein POVWA1_058010 [Plasmodium ovale wallikeri]SBT49025.1 hypothetical protein POVWA2_057360 [Plasmodium ovale wallikeri]
MPPSSGREQIVQTLVPSSKPKRSCEKADIYTEKYGETMKCPSTYTHTHVWVGEKSMLNTSSFGNRRTASFDYFGG